MVLRGTLIDGTQFDSSYDRYVPLCFCYSRVYDCFHCQSDTAIPLSCRGSPTTFAPNQVIKGWTEAMQLMVEGDKWELYIPSELGYGDRGSPPKIPGGDTLVFVIEIIKIKGDTVPALTCESSTGEGCNDQEKEYMKKLDSKALDSEKLQKEIDRLSNMEGKDMTSELKNWLRRRLRILRQKKDEL